jgi:hypothetical protein
MDIGLNGIFLHIITALQSNPTTAGQRPMDKRTGPMLLAKAARGVVDFLKGEKPVYPVNPEVLG